MSTLEDIGLLVEIAVVWGSDDEGVGIRRLSEEITDVEWRNQLREGW